MKTFKQSLKDGFIQEVEDQPDLDNALRTIGSDGIQSSWHFNWKDGENLYELWFEKLLFNDQYYVALYKGQNLMTEKVVIKPGYEKEDE